MTTKNKNSSNKYNTINMNMQSMCFPRSCLLGKYFKLYPAVFLIISSSQTDF